MSSADALYVVREWITTQSGIPEGRRILIRQFDEKLGGRHCSIQIKICLLADGRERVFELMQIVVLQHDNSVVVLKDRRSRVSQLLRGLEYIVVSHNDELYSHAEAVARFQEALGATDTDTPEWLLSITVAYGDIAEKGYDFCASVVGLKQKQGTIEIPLKICKSRKAKASFLSQRTAKQNQWALVLIIGPQISDAEIRADAYRRLTNLRAGYPRR